MSDGTIRVDPSVTDGRCRFCGAVVVVPATAGVDLAGAPIAQGKVPEDMILVRMCSECRADFERWHREEGAEQGPVQ